jgi:O-antigen biosynthesis protein
MAWRRLLVIYGSTQNEACISMLNILIIHIRFAEYDRCSGDLRLTNILRILSEHNRVALHILYKPEDFVDAPGQRQYLRLMQQLGIEVRTGSLRTRLREQQYDAVLIEFWYVARHLFSEIRALQPKARVIVDSEHVYFHSNYLKALALGRDPNASQLQDDKREELATYAKSDLVITTTDEDKTVLLQENPRLTIATIPNIHEVPRLDESADEKRDPNALVFVGNFSNNPANVDAMVHFCGEILPLIRRRVPGARLTIVGNKPPAAVQELACDYVTVTGYVRDVEPYLAASTVSVCPLRFGAGLKGKIGEAMIYGLPVVTTSIGTQGMNPRLGEDLMVGDTPMEFAHCVAQLLEQPALRQRLSRNGRDLVVRNYSFEAVAARIDEVVSQVGTVRIKRYRQLKRLAMKWRFDLYDSLQRHILWRFGRSG